MNEVTTVNQNENLPVEVSLSEMMGEYQKDDLNLDDIKIPKLLMMNALSKLVSEQEICKVGQLVHSVTGEIYADTKEGESVKVYPILNWKTWTINEVIKGKAQYVRTEPAKSQNDMDWNETKEDGTVWKNVYSLNYYVLLEKDLGNPEALPHVISFRSTGVKEGTNISTRASVSNMPIFMSEFTIGGEKKTNDDGTWYVPTARHTGDLDPDKDKAAMTQLFTWWKTLKASDHKDVDNSDIETAVETKLDDVEIENTEF